MKTIVFAHPWSGSFNKAILDSAVKRLEEKNIRYTLIDLNKEKFNPVMTEEELALFSKGECIDPMVEKYQKILKETSELILIFPIWWSSMPAIMKGFLDKVMLMNFAYRQKEIGIEGLLTNIKKAKIITTATTPKFIMRIAGFGITMKMGILGGIGVKKSKWEHHSFTKDSKEKREKFLEKIAKFIEEE